MRISQMLISQLILILLIQQISCVEIETVSEIADQSYLQLEENIKKIEQLNSEQAQIKDENLIQTLEQHVDFYDLERQIANSNILRLLEKTILDFPLEKVHTNSSKAENIVLIYKQKIQQNKDYATYENKEVNQKILKIEQIFNQQHNNTLFNQSSLQNQFEDNKLFLAQDQLNNGNRKLFLFNKSITGQQFHLSLFQKISKKDEIKIFLNKSKHLSKQQQREKFISGLISQGKKKNLNSKIDFKSPQWKNEVDDNIFDQFFNIERSTDGPWEDFDRLCKQSGSGCFQDKTFPKNRMLCWYNFRPSVESYNLIPIMESTLHDFKRLYDINKNYKLWSDDNQINYNDVAQGFTLGNCYFIAALGALANKKNLIERIFNFQNPEDSGKIYPGGIISVNVFICGVPHVVHIDDLFPVTESGNFFFAEPDSTTQNAWGIVLEKVWAKLNVNYEKTCAGWQHEVVRIFAGIGAEDYLVSQFTPDSLWDLLYREFHNGNILGGGTKGDGDHTQLFPCGIPKSHAFSILDAKQVIDDQGIKRRLFLLKNPWSTELYNGPCNDHDTKFWTPRMIKELNSHVLQDDGVFWLPIEQFHKTFLYVVVSHYRENWIHNYIFNEGDDGLQHHYIFDIKPQDEGTVFLTIDHYDTRMYPWNTKKDKIMTSVKVRKWDHDTQEYEDLSEKFGSDWIGFQLLKLEDLIEGHYLIVVQVQWVKDAKKDYTVGLYSAKQLMIQECVGYGNGKIESDSYYQPKDKCTNLIKGKSFKHGMHIGKRYENEEIKDSRSINANQGVQSVEKLLSSQIEELYPEIEKLPYLVKNDKGWFNEFAGQIVDKKTGLKEDKYLYSFSDKSGKFDMQIKMTAKCEGPASCVVFPRQYQTSMENKSVNGNKETVLAANCKVEPQKKLGKHCIMLCVSKQECKYNFKVEKWSYSKK